jgi:hypothetical protein
VETAHRGSSILLRPIVIPRRRRKEANQGFKGEDKDIAFVKARWHKKEIACRTVFVCKQN